jgi:hypothetical protein
MLAYYNICPWSDPKYKKRLHRLFVIVLFKYILVCSKKGDLPNINAWKIFANSYIKPIKDKLDESNKRSCASFLFQEEDEPLNQLETLVVEKWNKKMSGLEYPRPKNRQLSQQDITRLTETEKKIYEGKKNYAQWKKLKRTFNLKIYIRELLDNWGNAEEYVLDKRSPRNLDLQFQFNQLIYFTAIEWVTFIVERLNVDKVDKDLISPHNEYDILQYLFLVQDNTDKIKNRRHRRYDFIPREKLLNTIRKTERSGQLKLDNYEKYAKALIAALPKDAKKNIEVDKHNKILNNMRKLYEPNDDEKHQQRYYRKIRTYLSQYHTFKMLAANNQTKAKAFSNSLDNIILGLYNNYVNDPDVIINRIRDMDSQVANDLLKKYFSNDKNPLKTIKTYRGGKTLRKHRGIYQTGGKTGKLKKGYKYTGRYLKNGKAEIIKVKKIKKIKKIRKN